MKRVHVLFLGDVEGTGSRFFIKQKAIELGLKGYCQLNGDNQLEVEVEGSIEAVDHFISFVQKGISIQAEQQSFRLTLFDTIIGYKTMTSDIV